MPPSPQRYDSLRDLDGDGDIDAGDDRINDLDHDGRIDAEDRELERQRSNEQTKRQTVRASCDLTKNDECHQNAQSQATPAYRVG